MRKFFFTFFVVLSLAGLGFMGMKIINWSAQSAIFNMQDVTINGNHLVHTDEILNLIQIKPGTNITKIDLRTLQESIEKHPYIESALVSRRFPSALQINVVERIPVSFITGIKLYAVDRGGVLLPLLRSVALTGLPVITGINDFLEIPGKQVNSDYLIGAIELINATRIINSDLYQNLSEVNYDQKKGFTVYFNDARFPAFFGYDDYFEKAQKLWAFFLQMRQEQRYEILQYVDLRFQEQVVARFNPPTVKTAAANSQSGQRKIERKKF